MIASATAALSLGGGVASAQILADPPEGPTGTEPGSTPSEDSADAPATDAGGVQAAGGGGTGDSGTGTGGGDSTGDGGGGVQLKLEDVSPRKVFFSGTWAATFRYEIDGQGSQDLKIEVVNHDNHRVVKKWLRDDVQPGARYKVSWRGKTDDGGAAKVGRYYFRVRERGGPVLDRSSAKGDRYFRHYTHKFPVRGRHTYGDGIGAGRGHQGQDVFADCGTELQAARAGRVQWRAYQGSGAGHYLVIDGKATGRDYVYMHLKRGSNLRKGDRVRTGQQIGKVGASGNASGCHLHFELWSPPGWYDGGDPLNPTKKLKAWDKWS